MLITFVQCVIQVETWERSCRQYEIWEGEIGHSLWPGGQADWETLQSSRVDRNVSTFTIHQMCFCLLTNPTRMWETEYEMSHIMRKPFYAVCEQQRCRSAFVVHCQDSIILLVSISEIWSLYLASVTAQAGLSLTWSQTLKTGFLMTWLKYLIPLPRSCPLLNPAWNWSLAQICNGSLINLGRVSWCDWIFMTQTLNLLKQTLVKTSKAFLAWFIISSEAAMGL